MFVHLRSASSTLLEARQPNEAFSGLSTLCDTTMRLPARSCAPHTFVGVRETLKCSQITRDVRNSPLALIYACWKGFILDIEGSESVQEVLDAVQEKCGMSSAGLDWTVIVK